MLVFLGKEFKISRSEDNMWSKNGTKNMKLCCLLEALTGCNDSGIRFRTPCKLKYKMQACKPLALKIYQDELLQKLFESKDSGKLNICLEHEVGKNIKQKHKEEYDIFPVAISFLLKYWVFKNNPLKSRLI